MHPDIWGDATWLYLHCLTFSYPNNPPEEYKKRAVLFFNNLLLPCETCQNEYDKYIQLHPFTEEIVSSKDNIIRCFFDFHNAVDKRIGHPTLDFQQLLINITQ